MPSQVQEVKAKGVGSKKKPDVLRSHSIRRRPLPVPLWCLHPAEARPLRQVRGRGQLDPRDITSWPCPSRRPPALPGGGQMTVMFTALALAALAFVLILLVLVGTRREAPWTALDE